MSERPEERGPDERPPEGGTPEEPSAEEARQEGAPAEGPAASAPSGEDDDEDVTLVIADGFDAGGRPAEEQRSGPDRGEEAGAVGDDSAAGREDAGGEDAGGEDAGGEDAGGEDAGGEEGEEGEGGGGTGGVHASAPAPGAGVDATVRIGEEPAREAEDRRGGRPHEVGQARPMIQVEDLHKAFGKNQVLRGIGLEVLEGETVCIIGGSGTGKSVTLKHVMRLIDPDRGRIVLDGEDITFASGDRLQAARAKLGVNFQFGALLKWLTVFENVALPLRENTDWGEDRIRERVMSKLELLQIPEARDRYPNEISGGMQKRVGLARAVVMEESVKVILYDEPTSGLDPISTAMVDEMINEMKERLGLTQVVVTHDMASAYRVADRIAVLHKGEVVQYAPPEVIQDSQVPYVRQFVAGLTAPPDELSKEKPA